jgi:hypothetical protein
MVVGPDWNDATPVGVKQASWSSTQFSLAAFRIQLSVPARVGPHKKGAPRVAGFAFDAT